MIITWAGKENFIIKTKGQTIKVGAEIALGTFKIQSPGEYESSGVQVEVIDGTIEILSEKMTIAWIKKAKILSDQELEKLNGIDVLLLGVGGGEFTDTKTAIGVVNQIEPKVVIPMYSGNPPAGSPRFGEAGGEAGLESFTKEEGVKGEGQEQFKFSPADLPSDERKIVILNPSTSLRVDSE